MINKLKGWAKAIKRDIQALYLAACDPRTPGLVKGLAICSVAYALAPIDLIPDFIPVLGYLDDVIILPLAIMLIVKLIPPELMAEFRFKATDAIPVSIRRLGIAIIVGTWLLTAALGIWLMIRRPN
ncbi:MAG: YkvA family protein [bacterium]|nr:YkvA family protein [bacterium]